MAQVLNNEGIGSGNRKLASIFAGDFVASNSGSDFKYEVKLLNSVPEISFSIDGYNDVKKNEDSYLYGPWYTVEGTGKKVKLSLKPKNLGDGLCVSFFINYTHYAVIDKTSTAECIATENNKEIILSLDAFYGNDEYTPIDSIEVIAFVPYKKVQQTPQPQPQPVPIATF